ncbi:hypothetical protein B566_EDAN008788 [Ephemera danica]|nr:hypothetical protein B566_EDAN008788 [Ephemera danica]
MSISLGAKDIRLRNFATANVICIMLAVYKKTGMTTKVGLICSEGEMWREHRRFTTSCLKSLGMVRLGERRQILGEKIRVAAHKCIKLLNDQLSEDSLTPVDPVPAILHTLGNVVNTLVFGRQFAVDDPVWRWLQHLQEEGTKLIGVAGPLNFLPWLRFIPRYRQSINFLLDGKNNTHEIYRKWLKEDVDSGTTEGHVAGAYVTEMSRRPPGSEGSFTEPQCLHVLADVFGASVDTTMATISWFVTLMAANPSVQERVQAEIDAAVQARSANYPELVDMSSCPFTEAAIAETQRFRTVVPTGIPHGALEDCELGGFVIHRNTMIIPLQWAVHTSPELWGPDSCEFNPERFLNADGRFSRPDYFIPFQTGKRTCLGEEFAKMILFVYATNLLHRFSMKFADDTNMTDVLEGNCGITLNPKPYRLILTPRV